jgi:hypothetical protein
MGRAAIIAVAVTAAAGGAALVVTPSGGSPMANLWVDTNGGTCTDVAGAGGVYVDANACSSFDAANDTCEDGDVVRVKNGAYSGQGITGSNGRATPCSMIGESEAGVTMPTLTVQTAAAELDLADMTVTSTATGGGQLVYLQQATDISFDNFTIDHQWTTGANFKLGGDADGVTVTNSTICCVHNYPMLEIVNLGSGRNEDIVFEDTNIYGLSRDDFGDVHNEMFLIWGSPVTANLRMERVSVWDSASIGINYSNGIDGNFILRNTVWEAPKEYDGTNESQQDGASLFQGCAGGSDRSGWLWEYNMLEGGWIGCATVGGMTLRGNTGSLSSGQAACTVDADNVWDSNVWSNADCSASDDEVTDLFSDLGHWGGWTSDDFTPTSTNPGIDAGNSGSYPALDRLGFTRPFNTVPDAGPYEYGAG